MSDAGEKQYRTTVELDQGLIKITVRGRQTAESSAAIGEQVQKLTQQLQREGKRVYVIADISELSLSDISSGARRSSRSLLETISFDRAAVYGKSRLMTLVSYLVKVSGAGSRVRYFTSRRAAESFLRHATPRRRKGGQSVIGVVGMLTLTLIGVLALIGWATNNPYLTSWLPHLRPVNPVAAVGIIGMGTAFFAYWRKSVVTLRILGIVGLVIGFGALLPTGIDYILFAKEVNSEGTRALIADSAAICFLALGVIGLASYRTERWVQWVEYFAVFILGAIGLVNIFSQLYAYDWIYGISNTFVMAYNLAFACTLTSIFTWVLIHYRRTGEDLLLRLGRIGWMMIFILLLGQAATYVSWQQTEAKNVETARVAFNTQAKTIEGVLQSRFEAYINALYGYQGLFASSMSINQGEFDQYYQTTGIDKRYPGLRAFSLISKVKDSEMNAFVQSVRTDTSLHKKGNPTFKVLRPGKASTHYVLTYVAANPTATLGTDLGATADRRVAFKRAEATRKPVASGTVRFNATSTTLERDGFFITIPVAYDNKKIIGFVNAAFDYKGFFGDSLNNGQELRGVDVQISDGKSQIYDARKNEQQPGMLTYVTRLSVADHEWRIIMTAPPSYGVDETRRPLAVIISGQLFCLFLIGVFWIQARSRRRALRLVDDVTKDLQEERNLAVANAQKSQAILSSIGDGVFAVDRTGKITVLNPAAQEIAAITSREALGRPYNEVLRFENEKTGKINDGFIKKALNGHLASMTNHTVIARADGKRVPVADSAAPIRNVQGDILGAIVVFRDVSKEYELDRAKTEFVSLASHQLRTPLSAVNWYGEMLLNEDAGKLNKVQNEYIREIFEGSQRMVELVNSLLDVSRLEVGKLADNPQPTQLVEVIESLERELSMSAKSKKITLTKHLSKVPDVIADPKQVRMVIQNLMSNAVKYTGDKGAVSVTLRVATLQDKRRAKLKDGEPCWYFSVEDTGFGIPKDQQPKIFGKLFRADNVRKLDVEGTGLGLYIVKEVVEKMGGHVWFESVEGKGTAFYVVAPIEPKHKKGES